MPKLGMEPIRRDAVVKATIAEVGRTGTTDVTVGKIARRAGVSTALVHHYFGSKEAVLMAAMRHVLSVYGQEVRRALGEAQTPRARLRAIILASFSGENFEVDTISAWVNFYAAAQTSAPAQRLLRIYQRRIVANLTHALRPLIGDRAPPTARMLAALIDGIYLRMGLGGERPDPKGATRMVLRAADLELNHAE
ncbi:MAG: choline-binding transcriptional repressor BetI [Shimia sp.]